MFQLHTFHLGFRDEKLICEVTAMKKYSLPRTITDGDVEYVWEGVTIGASARRRSRISMRVAMWIGTLFFLAVSFILLMSLMFKYADMSSADDEKFFSVFGFLIPVFEFVNERIFTFRSFPWYGIVGICVGGAYLIPLICAAIVKIFFAIFVRPAPAPMPESGDRAATARSLALETERVTGYRPSGITEEQRGDKAPTEPNFADYGAGGAIILTLALAAVLIYGFIMYDIEIPLWAMIFGFAVSAVIFFFVAFALFSINALIDGSAAKFNSSGALCGKSVSERVDAYWLSADPEEAERRRELEREKQRLAELEAQRREEEEKSGRELFRRGLDAEGRGDYSAAEACFKKAADLGNPDGEYNYARYCMSHGNRSGAILYLKKAMEYPAYNDEESRRILDGLLHGASFDLHLD